MRDAFSKLHPLIGLVYFAAVISFTMFLMNPVCLAVSLLAAILNAVWLNGKRTVLFGLKFILPTVLLVMIINPVINHQGVTILGYLPWNNPLTLESAVYGAVSAAMLSAVVFWFSSVNTVMTSDKLVYLFGRIVPSLSLILSMALRFVPRFTKELRQVREAQKLLGKPSQGGMIHSVKTAVRVISVMMSKAMENSIETADSMKARGYGLKGRTAYAKYQLHKSDIVIGCLILLMTMVLIILSCFDAVKFRYFPSVKGDIYHPVAILFYLIYAALTLLPLILNVKEDLRWKRLQSAI